MGAEQVKAVSEEKIKELYNLAINQKSFQYFWAVLQVHPEISHYMKEIYLICLKSQEHDKNCGVKMPQEFLDYIPYLYPDLFIKKILPKLGKALEEDRLIEIYDAFYKLISFDNYHTLAALAKNNKLKKILTDARISSLVSSALKGSLINEDSLASQKFQIWLWNNLLNNDMITEEVIKLYLDENTEPIMTYVIIPNCVFTEASQKILYNIMAEYWFSNYNKEKWVKLLTQYNNVKRCSLWPYIFVKIGIKNIYQFINSYAELFCAEMWATALYLTDDIHDSKTASYLNAITISIEELSDIINVYRDMFPDDHIDFTLEDILRTYIRNTDRLAKSNQT